MACCPETAIRQSVSEAARGPQDTGVDSFHCMLQQLITGQPQISALVFACVC